ncbi:MAG: amidase [Roseovarius sp.]
MLTRSDYRERDATALAGLVRRGEVTALELLDTAIAEIERLDPHLNAVVMRGFEAARAAAAGAEASSGPFAGVPFLAKDINVDVAGFATTHGCRFFADAPPARADSALVRRWRKAGLVIAGRTNTPEFATDYGCEPELYGPTANPWDLSRTPGGSSGGAAVAVASGMVPMAHATDSGGSIRIPAACCGLFGFKPSSGVIATGSPLGPLVGGINVDHVVSRSVRDSAGMLLATAAPEPGAPTPRMPPPATLLDDLERPPGRLRIGVAALSPAGHRPDSETLALLEETRHLLEELGHETVEFFWPEESNTYDVTLPFWASELTAVIDARATALGRAPKPQELGPLVRWAVDEARRIDSVAVVAARAEMTRIRIRVAQEMAGLDALLLPAQSGPPLRTGLLTEWINESVELWAERAFAFAPYTEIFNVTGQPAMSLPLYQSRAGLPVGMQIAGKVGEDALMLRLARQIEDAQPWFDRHPPDPAR